MRLAEFLVYLLEAHAQTLHRLAALFGEEILIAMLEASGDDLAERFSKPTFRPAWFQAPQNDRYSSPYAEIEGAVREFKLPSPLEFHLWAYPHYRAFIESELDLDSRIPGAGHDVGLALVDEAVIKAEEWIRGLPIAEEFRKQAESAAHVPWLRFRTQALKRIGKRPMGPVY